MAQVGDQTITDWWIPKVIYLGGETYNTNDNNDTQCQQIYHNLHLE
jgi:hypothetical protein